MALFRMNVAEYCSKNDAVIADDEIKCRKTVYPPYFSVLLST